MEPSHPIDPCQELRDSVLARKLKQNARRAKAGKPPMWPGLEKPKKKRASLRSRAGKLPAPESGDEEDTALSFDEWKACGWAVKKGEKSQLQDIHGMPQFTRSQVRRYNPAWERFRQQNS
jgi:hypothetical protein